jgi:hypothetical protein
MRNAFGNTSVTHRYFDLGGRRTTTLLLAPNDDTFRSRVALNAKYRSNYTYRGKWRRLQKEKWSQDY